MKIIMQLIGVLTFFFVLISCNKDERQAANSIEGVWEVREITSIYGTFNNNTFISNTQKTETGDLGIFNFSETRTFL